MACAQTRKGNSKVGRCQHQHQSTQTHQHPQATIIYSPRTRTSLSASRRFNSNPAILHLSPDHHESTRRSVSRCSTRQQRSSRRFHSTTRRTRGKLPASFRFPHSPPNDDNPVLQNPSLACTTPLACRCDGDSAIQTRHSLTRFKFITSNLSRLSVTQQLMSNSQLLLRTLTATATATAAFDAASALSRRDLACSHTR